MKNCVYRFINENNEIIYVGKAKDLKNRLNSHKHLPNECYEERKRIEYIMFNFEEEMDFAERYFILKENPKYNTVLSNKDFGLRSIDLDVKEWTLYGSEVSICKNKKESNINTSLDSILRKLIELDIKEKMLVEYDIYLDENADTDVFLETRILMRKYEKDGMKILKKIYKNMDEKILQWMLLNRVDNINDSLSKELMKIEDEYFKICVDSIEQFGFYKVEIYENIDLEFVCTQDRPYFSWLHMFDGEFVINGLERYSIQSHIKNKLVDDIIDNIQERLIDKYGNLKREVIMLNSEVEYAKAFYPKYNYKKFDKPFIVYKLVS